MTVQEFSPAMPIKGEWDQIGTRSGATYWKNPLGILVGSAVEKTSRGPERHISISFNGKMPSEQDVAWARECFGAEDWERDDHSQWLASFWKPVNRDMIGDCECKEGG